MENIAPAISPPSGMGETKPANKAVLDWVHEVQSLTNPENIFWCDGSEAENDYLLGEACRQDVLIKLNQEKAARLLPASLQPERRRAGRAIHPHLHADGRRKPARPTIGPIRPRPTANCTAC